MKMHFAGPNQSRHWSATEHGIPASDGRHFTYPSINFQGILQLGRHLVLGGESIIHVDDDGRSMFGHDSAQKIVRVDIACHPTSSVGPDGDGEWSLLGGFFGSVDAILDAFDFTIEALGRVGWRRELGEKHGYQAVVHVTNVFDAAVHYNPTTGRFLQLVESVRNQCRAGRGQGLHLAMTVCNSS